MRLLVLIPISNKDFLVANKKLRSDVLLGLATVDVVHLPQGPSSIETAYDQAEAVIPLVRAAKQAEKDGYDGIMIDCVADPGLRVVRESVSIPVTSAGESSYLFAMSLCFKFSIIVVMKNTVFLIRENIHKFGLQKRVSSIRALNIPVLDLQHPPTYRAIKEQSILAIKDGAGAIVLGCTGMAGLSKKLTQEIDVPVIDPATSAILMLFSLVSSELNTSKVDFPLK